jgi:hypothetical protein
MTPEQKRHILIEARETLARIDAGIKTKPYTPPPGPPPPKSDNEFDSWPRETDTPQIATIPLVSTAAMDEWKADAEAREQAEEAEDERRRTADWLARSNAAAVYDQQQDDKIAQAVAAEREFTSQVLIKLTAHFNDEIRKLRDELRALHAEQHERELAFWTQHFARADAGKQDHGSVITLPAKRVS